ncbi:MULTISPECIES: DUF4352 domain-containing protein [unclassified Streptomyces]|uniref:DUF4352 domain-containing protein n=1 Tax=unclassified Streptomyces TaxID=2593676 RepID=UPI0033BBC31E
MSYQQPQPGWVPPRQPPRKSRAGKIVGFSCLGVVGLVIVFAIGSAALLGGGEDSSSASGTGPAAAKSATGPGGGDSTDSAEADESATEEPADGPVKVVARRTAFEGSALAEGTDYTSVRVTITNNGTDAIGVNPLYFSITATDGSRHMAELAVDENQIATVSLAPGENLTGTVTGKGTFAPEYVTYTDGLLGDSVRGDVS